MKSYKKIKPGSVLLSQPFMWDSHFKRSAIFITDHNEKDGTIGFIMNKSIDMDINQLMADFPKFEAEVSFGGPVGTDTIHYIHSVGHLLDDSIYVMDGVWWGGDFTQLKALIRNGVVKLDDIRFFVGYSGWSRGQLREEMKTGSWVVADMDLNYIFKMDEEINLWQEIMEHKGDTFGVIGQMPDGVIWN